MKLTYLFVLLLAAGCWAGCKTVDPLSVAPTYIHVDSFSFLQQDQTTTGSSSHAIGTVWAYYNNNIVGTWDLPCNIPIQASGTGALQLRPGVTVDGSQDYQSAYPYYLADTSSFTAQPGKIITYEPKTGYALGGTNFLFKEDFDIGNPFTNLSGDTSLVRTTNPKYVFQGAGSGLIYFSHANDSSENILQSAQQLSVSAGQSTIEIDNMGQNAILTVGLVGVINGTPTDPYYIAGFYPSATWHKEYISIGTALSYIQADYYLIVIKGATQSGATSGFVAIDNVKMLTDK